MPARQRLPQRAGLLERWAGPREHDEHEHGGRHADGHEQQGAAVQPGRLADGPEAERERHEGQPRERAHARRDTGADGRGHGVMQPPRHRDADRHDEQRQRDLDADHEPGMVAHDEDEAAGDDRHREGLAPSRRG